MSQFVHLLKTHFAMIFIEIEITIKVIDIPFSDYLLPVGYSSAKIVRFQNGYIILFSYCTGKNPAKIIKAATGLNAYSSWCQMK